MSKTSHTQQDGYATCLVDHHRLVNNANLYPDVFFNVDDKHELSAHYFILKMRLPQLLEDGQGIKKKKQKRKDAQLVLDIVKDQHITADALERVLIFAYCGNINASAFTPFKAVEVMRASVVFKIPRLLALSSKFLQESLTMENIFRLLKFSDSMDVPEAKTICIDFALQSPDFFTSANAEDLGFKLYQEVTSLLLKHHQNTDKKKGLMVIDFTQGEDTVIREFKHIHGSCDATGDITFNIQGEEIRAHKAILADQSIDFANLIVTYEANKDPKRNSAVQLEEKYERVTVKAFDFMLRYFYYGETEIDMMSSCELFPFAKDFKLVKLCTVLEKIIGGQNIEVPTCLSVLNVAYNPLMNENQGLQNKLKQEALDYAVANVDRIDFKPLEFMGPQISSHILIRLQQVIGSKWSSLGVVSGKGEEEPPEEELTTDSKKGRKPKKGESAASPTSSKSKSSTATTATATVAQESSNGKSESGKKGDKTEKEDASSKKKKEKEKPQRKEKATGAAEEGEDG